MLLIIISLSITYLNNFFKDRNEKIERKLYFFAHKAQICIFRRLTLTGNCIIMILNKTKTRKKYETKESENDCADCAR